MASLKELYERRKKLAEFPLLAGVSEEYLWELAEASEKLHLRRNEQLYSQGDASDYAYFILKGEVESERKLQSKEQEMSWLGYEKKYSNNGIKIRSYHGLQQPAPIKMMFVQGEVVGIDENWLKCDSPLEPRKQQLKCRTICSFYRVPLEQLKLVLLTIKPTSSEQGRHVLAQKNFSLGRLEDAIEQKKKPSQGRVTRDRLIRISLCKYNKLNNIPLELSAESRTLETKHAHRANKSSIQQYEPKKKQLVGTSKQRSTSQFVNEQNTFVRCLLQARAKKLVRAKYLFEDEPTQMKFQQRPWHKKLL